MGEGWECLIKNGQWKRSMKEKLRKTWLKTKGLLWREVVCACKRNTKQRERKETVKLLIIRRSSFDHLYKKKCEKDESKNYKSYSYVMNKRKSNKNRGWTWFWGRKPTGKEKKKMKMIRRKPHQWKIQHKGDTMIKGKDETELKEWREGKGRDGRNGISKTKRKWRWEHPQETAKYI